MKLLPIGPPGSGKSYILNLIADGYNSNRFESSNQCVSGLTKEIEYYETYAFNDYSQPIVKLFNAPGLGDYQLKASDYCSMLKNSLIGSQGLDVLILTVKQDEYRQTVQMIFTLSVLKEFFKGQDTSNVYVIFTHCDLNMPTQSQTDQRLQFYSSKTGFQFLKQNVYFFDNTLKSLKNFIQDLNTRYQSPIVLENNLQNKAQQVVQQVQLSNQTYSSNYSSRYWNMDSFEYFNQQSQKKEIEDLKEQIQTNRSINKQIEYQIDEQNYNLRQVRREKQEKEKEIERQRERIRRQNSGGCQLI